ncbi:hypothetical protein ACRQEV_08730, partial [Actinotignum sp. GS-2025c]
VGGATYQVPVEVKAGRSTALGHGVAAPLRRRRKKKCRGGPAARVFPNTSAREALTAPRINRYSCLGCLFAGLLWRPSAVP